MERLAASQPRHVTDAHEFVEKERAAYGNILAAVEWTVRDAVLRAEHEEALTKAQLRQGRAQEQEQAAERHRAECRKLADRFKTQVDELVRALAYNIGETRRRWSSSPATSAPAPPI